MNSDCYWNIVNYSEPEEISNLLSVCKSSSVAANQYIEQHQWKLMKLCDFDEDDDIQARFGCLMVSPVLGNMFYGKVPLTKFHVKCLNKAIQLFSADEEKYEDIGDIRLMMFPDHDIMKTVAEVLLEELRKLEFEINILYQEYTVYLSFIIQGKVVRKASFFSNTVDNGSIFDPDYVKLLKYPVWLRVSNDHKRLYNSDLFYSMRTGNDKILLSNRKIPLPPSILTIYEEVNPGYMPGDFSFLGLSYAEILYGLRVERVDHIDGLKEKIESVVGYDVPIKLVKVGDSYRLKRTDIPPNSRDFWIFIEPNPKPTDKPLISYEDPFKEKIELYSLLSVLHNLDRKKQDDVIKILIRKDMLSTQIPLNLLLLTDDEILNGGIVSSLLSEAKERNIAHLLPRLLFIYDILPPSQEKNRYMESLSREVKLLIEDIS